MDINDILMVAAILLTGFLFASIFRPRAVAIMAIVLIAAFFYILCTIDMSSPKEPNPEVLAKQREKWENSEVQSR